MKSGALQELKTNLSNIINDLAEEDVVVTRDGEPAALLVYLDEDSLDEFMLARHPAFLKEIEAARDEYEREGGIDHSAMKKRIEGDGG